MIRLKQECKVVPLLGNHEEMLLGALEGNDGLRYWLMFGGPETLASYGVAGPRAIPRNHLDFIRACVRYHETDGHLFLHANYWPNRPMNEQTDSALLWEVLRPDLVARHYSGKTAIVGHSEQRSGDILDLGFLKCIDTFCYGGGWLTALDVTTGEFWQANQQGLLRQGTVGKPCPDWQTNQVHMPGLLARNTSR